MKFSRRDLLAVSGATVLLASVGCANRQQYPAVDRIKFEEEISSVLISSEAKKLVILGNRNHYVFDDVSSLIAILRSQLHSALIGSFGAFEINLKNQIYGRFTLSSKGPLSATDAIEARRLGFTEVDSGRFEFSEAIVGKRFQPTTLTTSFAGQALNQKYTIAIQEIVDASGTDRKIEASPVRQGPGGEIFLLALLLPLIAVFSIFGRGPSFSH